MLKNKFALGVIAALAVVVTLGAVNGVFNSVNSTTGYQVNSGTTVLVKGFALCSGTSASRFDGACPMPIYGSGTPSVTGAVCGPGNINQEYVDTTTYNYWFCKVVSGPTFFFAGPFGGTASTVFYQTVTGQPQEPALTFSSAFSLADNAGVATNVGIAAITPTTTSTAGTIVGAGAGCDSTSFSAAGTYYVDPMGIYHQHVQGKTQSDCSSSPNNGRESIVLPHSCPTAVIGTQVSNLAPVLDTDDTHQGSQSLVSVSTTTVVTQRYRSADHGASDSAPAIDLTCY